MMKKAIFIFCASFCSMYIQAQNNPVNIEASDKLVLVNEGDTSHLLLKSINQPSFLDLQSANRSSIRFLENGSSQAELNWSGSNLDLFSMPPVTFPQLRTPTIRLTTDRKVGINKGLLSPTEALDVNGRLKIGYREGTATPGVLRYNPDEKKFESYNGANWKSFGNLSLDDDGDSGISLQEDIVDSIVMKVNGNEELRFGGHSLEFGKDGNTYIGKGVTPTDTPQNIGNTVTGWLSARSMFSGVSNTIYGFRSSEELNTGDFNTIVGSQTANKLSIGSRNTFLGYRAGWNSGAGNSGNVYIGYRAGEGMVGSDRLVISNSETTTPLIDGNFASQQLDVYGNLDVNGNSILDGQVQINGITTLTNQLTSQDIKIDDNNPFLEFKQLGNSQFYFQYQSSSDQLVLVESGVGQVARFKDGEIYFPALASQAGKLMKLDPSGKVIFEDEPNNPSLTYYGSELQLGLSDLLLLDLTRDFIENNKTSITEFKVRVNWASIASAPSIFLGRINRTTGAREELVEIDPPSGSYNTVFTANLNHIVDTANYNYFITSQITFLGIMDIEVK